jgi:membrane-associated protease RseP (regulator of RpoE activity)
MHRVFLLAALIAPVLPAAEPAKTPDAVKPAELSHPAAVPFLGVRFDENSVALNTEPGMPVSEVVANSSAANLGLQGGDHLLTINGKPVKKTDDIKKILGGAKVGDPLSMEFVHAGQKVTGQGQLIERPKPAVLAKEVDQLTQKLAQVKELADAKSREPSLGEILQQLKDIETGLPRAVAAFKKQYPDGEFDIKIQVTIVSDKKAKNPIEFSNSQAAPAPTADPAQTPPAATSSSTPAPATPAPTK